MVDGSNPLIRIDGPGNVGSEAAAVGAIGQLPLPPSVSFQHSGGPIGIQLFDINFTDNVGSTTWELIPINQNLPTVSISTLDSVATGVAISAGQPDTASWSISRTNVGLSQPLTVKLVPMPVTWALAGRCC